MSSITFTPSLFFKHATCPHWIWFDRFGDMKKKGETPALAEKLLERGVLHEAGYVKGLKFVEVKATKAMTAVERTLELMREGAELIYQGEIEYEADGIIYRGRPDLLERHPGYSTLGDYFYIPVDIKSSTEVNSEQWMQLTLYAKILEQVQGVFPEDVAIINRNHDRVPFVIKNTHRKNTFARIDEIVRVMGGYKPPLKLASDCKSSPWYSECLREAEEANDIALLYRLDSRSHPTLREAGINTVNDAAEMDVGALPKVPYASPKTLDRIKLQAKSLVDDQLKWIKHPELPETSLNIYFDIEGDPLLNIQYLWGFWIVGDPEGKYARIGKVRQHEDGRYFVYFLAEQPEDEKEMWSDFLAWLELLPKEDLTVWHYHHYEATQCKALAEDYGGSDALVDFMKHFVDLCKVVQECVIFPLYFYSIKDIAKSRFLNFKWRHEKAGGAQSIFWYEEWLETGDRAILEDIVNYNEDDVHSTEYLHLWLKENKV